MALRSRWRQPHGGQAVLPLLPPLLLLLLRRGLLQLMCWHCGRRQAVLPQLSKALAVQVQRVAAELGRACDVAAWL